MSSGDERAFEDTRNPASSSGGTGHENGTAGANGTSGNGQVGGGVHAGESSRRARTAGQAASRARRIGGAPAPAGRRPSPRPRPTPEGDLDRGPRPDDVTSASRDTGTVRTAEPELAPRPSPRRRAESRARSRSPRWLPAAVAAVLVGALVVVDLMFWHPWRHHVPVSEQRQKLLASVNTAVAKVLSYDYRHIDKDKLAAAAFLTGAFKTDYIRSMDTTIKPQAPKLKVVVTGEVGSSGISAVTSDGKQATVLVLGQQTVTNSGQPTPSLDAVSLRVTAQLVNGRWLIAKLDRL